MRAYTDRTGRPSKDATVDHLGYREWQAQPYPQDIDTLGHRSQLPTGRPTGPKRYGLRIDRKSWCGGGRSVGWDKWYSTKRQRDDALRGINAKNDVLETRAVALDDR